MPADVDRLAELEREALDELAGFRGGELFRLREAPGEPLEDALRAALDDEDHVVLAGTIDESVIGYGIGRVEALRDGTRLGVIEAIFVEPEARSVAVGEALMGELLAWFNSRGCRAVDAMALPGDRQTKNFFEGSGFSARLLVMHHRMP